MHHVMSFNLKQAFLGVPFKSIGFPSSFEKFPNKYRLSQTSSVTSVRWPTVANCFNKKALEKLPRKIILTQNLTLAGLK